VGEAAIADPDGAYTISGAAAGTYSIEVSLAGYNTGAISAFDVSAPVSDKDIQLTAVTVSGTAYTISGTVSVNDSGSPAGAQVQLRQDGSPVGSVASADSNGAYTISGAAAGTYTIEVSLAGYTTGAIASFTVTGTVSGKNIQLTTVTVSSTVYTISGTVSVSDSGSPAGAQVQLRQDGSPVGQAAIAGSDGAYTISGVAAGTYTIEVSLAGYTTGAIAPFTVSGTVSGKDIQLTAVPTSGTAYTISGTVSVNDGGSPAGAQVQLRQAGSPVSQAVTAASNGAYTINGAAGGTYTIEVSLAGYTTGTIDSFTVSSNVSGKNIQLAKTSTGTGNGNGSGNGGNEPGPSAYYVRGTITIDDKVPPTPAVGATVILRKSGEVATFGQAVTDSTGAYKIDLTGITPGYWVAKVSMSGWQPGEIKEFEVTGTKDITKVDLRIWPSSYTVSGTITTDIPGGAASGATVILNNKSGYQVASTTTNSSGYYIFDKVDTGDGYSLEASLAGYKLLKTNSNIGISTGNVVRNLTLEASRYDVSGTISTNLGDNTRASGAKVELKQNGAVVKTEYTTYGSGDYEFEDVLTGTYTIDVSYAGFISASISSFPVSGNVTGKDLKLIQQTEFSVSGTVSLSDGGGAVGASVQLRQSNNTAVGSPVTAGSGGAYTINNVAKGDYKVEASLAGYKSGVAEFTVSGSDVTGKDLTLQKESATPTAITGMTLAAAFDLVKAQASGSYLIELGQNETNVADYALTGFSTPVTITVDGKGKTVNWASGINNAVGCLTLSQAGVTLVLKNVTFTGPNDTSKTQSLVRIGSGATLQMENGVTLTDNYAASGGGVYVLGGGFFTMNGGSITGNKYSTSGGGVHIAAGGTMTMTGGSVTGNNYKDTTRINNDVAVATSSSAGPGTLIMSGNAQIGRIHLGVASSAVPAAITINSGLPSSDPITIDVTSLSTSISPVDKQILKGTAVSSIYSHFVFGVAKSLGATAAGTDMSSGYFIDSSGYLRKEG
jgi:hypothetical protein